MLDLEGTLITSAVSIIPRPGLYDFLEYCNNKFDEIVVMTAISLDRFKEVKNTLLNFQEVPQWFEYVQYINYSDKPESNYGEYKDLQCVPNWKEKEIIIIDDMESYIRPEQKDRWIPITTYDGRENDLEFDRIVKYMDKL